MNACPCTSLTIAPLLRDFRAWVPRKSERPLTSGLRLWLEQERSAGISYLVHNPSVLILDEATGALDNASQAVVTQAMQALDATRIVIAEAVPRKRIQAN